MAASHLFQVILFSHPGDFTPVCTTELGEVARRADDFAKRNVKVIGISANNLTDHHKWIQDINDYGSKVGPTDVQFPIVSTSLFDFLTVISPDIRLPMRIGEFPLSMTCLTSRMPQIAMRRGFLSRYVPPAENPDLNPSAIDPHSFCDRPKEGHSPHDLLPCVHGEEL